MTKEEILAEIKELKDAISDCEFELETESDRNTQIDIRKEIKGFQYQIDKLKKMVETID